MGVGDAKWRFIVALDGEETKMWAEICARYAKGGLGRLSASAKMPPWRAPLRNPIPTLGHLRGTTRAPTRNYGAWGTRRFARPAFRW